MDNLLPGNLTPRNESQGLQSASRSFTSCAGTGDVVCLVLFSLKLSDDPSVVPVDGVDSVTLSGTAGSSGTVRPMVVGVLAASVCTYFVSSTKLVAVVDSVVASDVVVVVVVLLMVVVRVRAVVVVDVVVVVVGVYCLGGRGVTRYHILLGVGGTVVEVTPVVEYAAASGVTVTVVTTTSLSFWVEYTLVEVGTDPLTVPVLVMVVAEETVCSGTTVVTSGMKVLTVEVTVAGFP